MIHTKKSSPSYYYPVHVFALSDPRNYMVYRQCIDDIDGTHNDHVQQFHALLWRGDITHVNCSGQGGIPL